MFEKQTESKRARGVGEVVEHLPSKEEALNSISSTTPKNVDITCPRVHDVIKFGVTVVTKISMTYCYLIIINYLNDSNAF